MTTTSTGSTPTGPSRGSLSTGEGRIVETPRETEAACKVCSLEDLLPGPRFVIGWPLLCSVERGGKEELVDAFSKEEIMRRREDNWRRGGSFGEWSRGRDREEDYSEESGGWGWGGRGEGSWGGAED